MGDSQLSLLCAVYCHGQSLSTCPCHAWPCQCCPLLLASCSPSPPQPTCFFPFPHCRYHDSGRDVGLGCFTFVLCIRPLQKNICFGCQILGTLLFIAALVRMDRFELNTSPIEANRTKFLEIGLFVFFLHHGLSTLTSVLCVSLHRRHLMVWDVFAPKFMFDTVIALVVQWVSCVMVFLLVGLAWRGRRPSEKLK